MEVLAAQDLIAGGPAAIVFQVASQTSWQAPVVNPDADFNRSITFSTPVKTEKSSPFDIILPSSSHAITIPGQTAPTVNPYLLTAEPNPALTLAGILGPGSEPELTARQIVILSQIDWPKVMEIKNSGKTPGAPLLGFNKDVMVKILAELGYKAANLDKKAVVNKLLEYKMAYDRRLNDPRVQAILRAGAAEHEGKDFQPLSIIWLIKASHSDAK